MADKSRDKDSEGLSERTEVISLAHKVNCEEKGMRRLGDRDHWGTRADQPPQSCWTEELVGRNHGTGDGVRLPVVVI